MRPEYVSPLCSVFPRIDLGLLCRWSLSGSPLANHWDSGWIPQHPMAGIKEWTSFICCGVGVGEGKFTSPGSARPWPVLPGKERSNNLVHETTQRLLRASHSGFGLITVDSPWEQPSAGGLEPRSCYNLVRLWWAELWNSFRQPCSWHNGDLRILASFLRWSSDTLCNSQCSIVGGLRVLGFHNQAIYCVSAMC